MKSGYVGIDVAVAKGKHLPIVVCTWEEGRLVPRPLRRLYLIPPKGQGNVATLDQERVLRFAREARTYVEAVCNALGLHPTRIGIDAPSASRDPNIPRRSAETALDRAGISCFATPSAHEFEDICTRVSQYLATGGAEDRIPHSNQLWMLVGFAIFKELSRLAPCLEVFPQATVRAIGSGQLHKFRPGAVSEQLATVASRTGWPSNRDGEAGLSDIAWGERHDQLDAYLSAWVASLEEPDRAPYGRPPHDVIWVPRVPDSGRASTQEVPTRAITSQMPTTARAPMLCPACRQKEFKRWPWGWDAHAAHTCSGLSGRDPEERKAEYLRRFADHFRR